MSPLKACMPRLSSSPFTGPIWQTWLTLLKFIGSTKVAKIIVSLFSRAAEIFGTSKLKLFSCNIVSYPIYHWGRLCVHGPIGVLERHKCLWSNHSFTSGIDCPWNPSRGCGSNVLVCEIKSVSGWVISPIKEEFNTGRSLHELYWLEKEKVLVLHVWAVLDETNSENKKVENKKAIKALVMVSAQSRAKREKRTMNTA